MTEFRNIVFIIVLCVLNILDINDGAIVDPGFRLFPLQFPMSPNHVTWSSRALHAVPSTLKLINTIKNEDALIGEICKIHFQQYLQSLTINQSEWALQMFDSSTKIPESVASGAVYHLGNFDQCLAVRGRGQLGSFHGQYCGATMTFSDSGNFSLFLQIASCIPSSCTAEDLQNLLQFSVGGALEVLGITVEVKVPTDNCYIDGDKPYVSSESRVFITILIFLTLVVIVCTILDLLKINTKFKKVNLALNSFSVTRNLKTLINTEHARGSIQCMHGVRVGSLFWVILGHRYSHYDSLLPLMNPVDLAETYSNISMQLILNAMPAVDTFFVMSGLLACYLLIRDLSKGIKFDAIKYYLHRYIRLTTCYAVVIGFYATVLGDIGYGPTWRSHVKDQTKLCKDTWWSGLLYIDNYVRLEQYSIKKQRSACLGAAWYLTVDMQLAWLAPLVLLPLYYWPKWATKGLILLILASCFAPFTSAYLNNFYMHNFAWDNPAHSFKFSSEMYVITYYRATSYLIGICIAYFMYKIPKQDFNISKWLVACGWISSTVIGLIVVLAPTVMYQPDYQYDRVGSAFYNGFHRLAWAAVIGWIIVACHYGYGGPVNKLLSWNAWLPLSRLSYCIYLVHSYVMYIDIIQARTTIYFDHFAVIQRFFGDIIYSVMLSSVLHLFVEAPTLGLLRAFLKNKNIKKDKTQVQPMEGTCA